jgi:type I restriction enzyme S subunit
VSSSAESTAVVIDQMTQGWETKQIQEVAQVNPRIDKKSIPDDLKVSFVPMPAVEAESGHIDVSQTKPAKDVKKGFTAFLEGDVLFAKITPCMENGKMAVVPEVSNGYGFGSTEFHVLRPGNDIDAKYLYYFVSSKKFRGEAERHMTGAVGQRRVPTPYLKEASIPIAPLEDQKRIVAEIEKQFSRLDEAVASLKRVKANLKRYKAAVLKAAVEGKLTEEWRKQNPDVEPASKLLERILAERRAKWEEAELAKMKAKGKAPKNDKWKARFVLSMHVDAGGLPNLPDGWCYTNMACLVEEPKYGTSKKCRYEAQGRGVLRIPNIGDGVIDDEDLKYAKFDDSEIAAYSLNEDDLLVIRSNGSLDLVGKTALVRGADCSYLYAGYLIRLRPIQEIVSGAYLQSAVGSLAVRSQIESKAKSTSGVNNINAKELKTLIIPVCSKDEQMQVVREIEGRLSVADHLLNDVQMRINKAESIRQSILARSYSGYFARGKAELHMLKTK